ncbi:hypothetical protein D3C71_1527050 [compost metagenome]
MIAVLHHLHPIVNRTAPNARQRDALLDQITPFHLGPGQRLLHSREAPEHPGHRHIGETVASGVMEHFDDTVSASAHNRLDHNDPVPVQHGMQGGAAVSNRSGYIAAYPSVAQQRLRLPPFACQLSSCHYVPLLSHKPAILYAHLSRSSCMIVRLRQASIEKRHLC